MRLLTSLYTRRWFISLTLAVLLNMWLIQDEFATLRRFSAGAPAAMASVRDIGEMGLFGALSLPASTVDAAPSSQEYTASASVSIQGIFYHDDPVRSRAIITLSGQAMVVKTGQSLDGGGRVVRIEKQGIALEQQGNERYVPFIKQ